MTRLEISPLLLSACVATAAFPPGCGDAAGGAVTDSSSSTDSSSGETTTEGTTTNPATEASTAEAPTTGAPTTSTTDASTTDASTTDPSTTDPSTGTTSTDTGTDTDSSSSTDPGSSTGSAVCGDGVIDGPEECDDGRDNADTAPCTSACLKNVCGDGLVLAGSEACDDGGESAACNADCSVASCGDGVVNAAAGETCDDGGESAACDVDCTAAQCSDGVKNTAAGEACDDGNMVGDDACSNLCELGGIVLGGNKLPNVQAALDATGAPYTVENEMWVAPNSAGIIVLSHDGGADPVPDYAPHFAAGAHLLVIGGSTDETYGTFIHEHFDAIVNQGSWHTTSDCDPDWTRGPDHPITALMPATHEFSNQSVSYHMVHLFGEQPAGVTVLGDMCHNAPNDAILITRKHPGGGTVTYLGFAVNVYSDATSQAEFLVPLLEGYLDWVDQGAP